MPTFEFSFTVDATLDEVSAFHFRPGILKTLTPPLVIMQVHEFEPLADGSAAEFTMWLGPVPVHWKAVHSNVSPTGFTDTQTDGPMKSWVHTHTFCSIDSNTTTVHEHIDYEHHSGLRGVWSRILFPPFALSLLFAIRCRITRKSISRSR